MEELQRELSELYQAHELLIKALGLGQNTERDTFYIQCELDCIEDDIADLELDLYGTGDQPPQNRSES